MIGRPAGGVKPPPAPGPPGAFPKPAAAGRAGQTTRATTPMVSKYNPASARIMSRSRTA